MSRAPLVGSLDETTRAAWADVEAALPEGWEVVVLAGPAALGEDGWTLYVEGRRPRRTVAWSARGRDAAVALRALRVTAEAVAAVVRAERDDP